MSTMNKIQTQKTYSMKKKKIKQTVRFPRLMAATIL